MALTREYDLASVPAGRFARPTFRADQYGNVVGPSPEIFNLQYDEIFRMLENQDIREYSERFQWENLPKGMNAQLMERILYYRGKFVAYYSEEAKSFMHLPFALNGGIDVYGRYRTVNSLPFLGVNEATDKKSKKKYPGTKDGIEVVYDYMYDMNFPDPEDLEEYFEDQENGSDKGIILTDQILQLSQNPISRSEFIKPVLCSMATCMQIINTAMFASADMNMVACDNEGQLSSLNAQLDTINHSILKGRRFMAVAADGALKLESLRTTNAALLQDLWEVFNSFDNFRKSTMGVANAGVFNKKERMLQQEQQLNGSNADAIYADSLYQRQYFCTLFQHYYGGLIWCRSKETPTNVEQMSDAVPDGEDYGTNYQQGETIDQNLGGE